MQLKAAGVRVDGGILGHVGVVDHTVLGVGHEGMDFHIVVGGEPLVEDFLTVGSPEDSPVQHAAVLEGVRQTGDVDAAAVAEGIDSHLDFLVLLDQNIGALIGVDALLALAKVHLTGHIGQDEVLRILFPVVLVIVQGEAGFLLHTQHTRQLEVVALVLVAGGLTDTDESAAIVDEFPDGGGNGGVLPFRAAGVGGISVAHVDDYINIVQNGSIAADIVKGDESHIKGGAGQGLDDAGIGIVLLLVQGVVDHVAAPCTHLTPAVQDRHGLDAVGGGALNVLVELPELVADGFHIVDELGELERQLQVAAVADPVDGLAQDGPPGGDPVFLGFLYGIAALVEGVREEIGQETPLGVFDTGDIGNQTQGGAVAHRADHRIQADGLEFLQEGLGANPVVAQEHHGLLAQLMGDIHHFLGKGRNLPALEGLEVLELLGGDPVLVIVVALVHDEFGAELVAHFLLKLLQDIGGHRGGIAIPVHVFFPLQLVKHQGKLVEEGGVADDVHVGVVCDELAQPLHGEFVGLGLADVEGDLVLKVLPVVGDGVVHVDGIPDEVCQKGHGIFVECLRPGDHHAAGLGVIVPAFRGNGRACGPVHDLPPALDVVPGVDLHQFRADALHQRNLQCAGSRGVEAGHDVALLHLVGIGLGPGIVLPGGVVGGVDLCVLVLKLRGEIGAITVTDGIGAPALQNFQRFGDHVQIRGNGNSTG